MLIRPASGKAYPASRTARDAGTVTAARQMRPNRRRTMNSWFASSVLPGFDSRAADLALQNETDRSLHTQAREQLAKLDESHLVNYFYSNRSDADSEEDEFSAIAGAES